MNLVRMLQNESISKMHVQNFENKIILETSPKANGIVVHNIFNINLIKFNQSNISRKKCFFPFKFGIYCHFSPDTITLLILMKTFDWMT